VALPSPCIPSHQAFQMPHPVAVLAYRLQALGLGRGNSHSIHHQPMGRGGYFSKAISRSSSTRVLDALQISTQYLAGRRDPGLVQNL